MFDSSRLVARSVFRGWRQAPARAIAAVVAGTAGVLLTTLMLYISAAVLDAIKGAPIGGIQAGTVAVQALAPGGMSADLVDRIEAGAGVTGSRIVVANARAMAGNGDTTYPVIVFGVDGDIAAVVDERLSRQLRDRPLTGPDEVYLARSWADDRGLRQGDAVRLLTPTGVRPLRVAGLLDGEVANHGAVIIAPRAAVAAAFLRGDNADVVLLAPGQRDHAAVSAGARAAADGAAAVMAPDALFSDNSKTFQTPRTILLMFAFIAVLTAGVVLFVTWRLAMDDARPMLARLRLIGVRTRDMALGSALAMLPLLLVTYVLGAVLGVLLGLRMSSFTTQITVLTQQAVEPGTPWVLPVVEAFVAALAMFAVAWGMGIRKFAKITAIDAVTGRDQVALRPGGSTLPLAIGAAALVLGVAAVALLPAPLRSGSLVPLLVAAGLLAVVLPVALGALLRRGEPGPLRLGVSRQLRAGWRRNAALGITFSIAVTMSLAMAGVAGSILADVSRSVDRWTQADLYVQAAEAGQNLQNEVFPASLQAQIAAVDGVTAIATFTFTLVGIDGRRVQVWNWGGPDLDRLVQIETTEGPASAVRNLGPDQIAISSNFARTRGLSVGDTMRLPLPDGARQVTVVAVVADSSTDGGMIVAGEQLYRQLAGNDGIYEYYVGVRPGADVLSVRQQILAAITTDHPRAAVLTQTQMRDQIASIASRLVSAFVAFSWVMFLLAVLIGGASLASGLVERRRGFALWRVSGASARLVTRQVVAESVLIGTLSWLVALPIGYLAIPALLDALSVQSGLLPPVQIPVPLSVLSLPLVIGCMLVALLLANPRRVNMPLRQLLEAE